ncbi:hypothetical protein AAG906_012358 [Vitis piasezkii]
MVLTSTDPALIKTLITWQSKEFAMKYLGSLHYFLSVEVQHNSQGLFLSQTKYALDLLQHHFRALKRILRYVKGIVHHGLQLHHTSSHDCHDTRGSTSGYLIFFSVNFVSWCSKKQSIVSRSDLEVSIDP